MDSNTPIDDIEDLISKISMCEQEGYVTFLLQDIFEKFNVTSFMFVTLLQDSRSRDSFRFHTGCDPRWFNQYNKRKWHEVDPLVAYSRLFSKPILLSEMTEKSDISQGQIDFFANMHSHGFKSGMVIPCHSVSTKRMGMLFVGNTMESCDGNVHLKKHRILLRAVANELLDWWIARLQSKTIDRSKLKTEDLKILKLAYHDGTSNDIALSLGLTVSQVNNRFRNINSIFQVDNKKDAAVLAMEYGIITPY
jgi:DNA-binding CsgD family transcriptional regulator